MKVYFKNELNVIHNNLQEENVEVIKISADPVHLDETSFTQPSSPQKLLKRKPVPPPRRRTPINDKSSSDKALTPESDHIQKLGSTQVRYAQDAVYFYLPDRLLLCVAS